MAGGKAIRMAAVSRPCAVLRANFAHNFEALANDVRKIVQNLRQVAAGFLLDQQRGHEKANVNQRDALAEVQQRVAQRKAEILFFERIAKFASQWLGHFRGNHLQASGERMAGANGAAEQINGFGKGLFKGPQTPGTNETHPESERKPAIAVTAIAMRTDCQIVAGPPSPRKEPEHR